MDERGRVPAVGLRLKCQQINTVPRITSSSAIPTRARSVADMIALLRGRPVMLRAGSNLKAFGDPFALLFVAAGEGRDFDFKWVEGLVASTEVSRERIWRLRVSLLLAKLPTDLPEVPFPLAPSDLNGSGASAL